ncbi:MAG: hypothetical protein KF724_00815 [Phycisphaeraceae bacterium]|nr:hypothetical protein [Phycisphaeraceae bacterium]
MSVLASLVLVSFLAAQRAEAEALLREVEETTEGLRDFSAEVVIDRVDALTEESERRMGRVVLEGRRAADSSRASEDGTRIVLLLDRFIGPDGRADESRRHFIYDSGWFAEVDHDRRQFVNRQVVPPGETFDPLRVGEGPLPIPIGQRADDALAYFDAMPAQVPSSGLLQRLEGVRGVRLTPKAGTPDARETISVDLFYDASSHLPRGVIQRRVNGNRVEVLLRNPAMNSGVSEGDRAIMRIRTPDPREGWSVDVRPWRRSAEPMDRE